MQKQVLIKTKLSSLAQALTRLLMGSSSIFKNPCDLDLWPMTLIFNRLLEVIKMQTFIKMSAAVHELSCCQRKNLLMKTILSSFLQAVKILIAYLQKLTAINQSISNSIIVNQKNHENCKTQLMVIVVSIDIKRIMQCMPCATIFRTHRTSSAEHSSTWTESCS